ncbi:MAG: orc1/cdc6 family replication initiation protein [Desulfurococcales archaeon]|nr:orc1/cdc6 family replication initiation protein [Desulfurococcales archaeon]
MAYDILDEIIERKLKSRHRIFADKEKLHPDYIPDYLPHREEQIKRVASILVSALEGVRPSNILIYGLTGTGKTAVTLYVLKRLGKKAIDFDARFKYAYVNTRKTDTTYRVLADIARSLGLRIPYTGLAIAEVYRRYVEALENWGGVHIVVLDEIDYYVRKHGDDLLYKLTRINEELEHSKVSLIGITNDINFVENLDPRVRSSLGEEEIVFPPYNAEQLYDILMERAKQAFNPNTISNEVIRYCAALAAREHGDARRALDLLRVAGEIAEREMAEKVTVKHVKKAAMEIEYGRIQQVVSTLPLHAKLVLKAIIVLVRKHGHATTGETYNYYREFARSIGLEPLTQRRVSELINELDMLGLVNAVVVNRGRYGKTKMIRVGDLIDVIDDALERFMGE